MKETRLNVTGGDITGTHVALGGAPQYNVKTINLYNTFMNANKPYVIGVDLGGTNTVFGIVNANGEVIAENSIRTQEYPTAEAFVEAGCACLQPIIEQVGGIGRIKAMGIGAPNGNYYTGNIEHSANLPWKGIVPLAEEFKKTIGVPVTVTNDANAAAIGEMTYGAARGMKNFIEITLGTGVGSGIVVNGQLVYGHDGFAGELGHVISRRYNGRQCGCGRCGCLETYCSATGVARTAKEKIDCSDEPTLLRDIEGEITSKDVYDAAVRGDKVAQEVFAFTGAILGEALADFIAFSAPEAIVLFGGLTKAGDLIMKPTLEAMEANVLSIWKGKTKLLVSELKDSDAAVLGASALAWE